MEFNSVINLLLLLLLEKLVPACAVRTTAQSHRSIRMQPASYRLGYDSFEILVVPSLTIINRGFTSQLH